MTSLIPTNAVLRMLTTIACATTLVACGGGSESADMAMSSSSAHSIINPSPVASAATQATGMANGTAALVSKRPVSRGTAVATGSTVLTSVRIESTELRTTQSNVPVTFGQVFALGALQRGTTLIGRVDDGTEFPLQLDVKATHADGSIRHAIISAVVPSLGARNVRTISLVKSSTAATTSQVTAASVVGNGFNASVEASINGVQYRASADSLLKQAAAPTWLAGAVANEWHVNAPLTTESGAAHPHLMARFAIRWYDAIKKARVDVTVENNWAYAPAPQNFTYDAKVTVGGKPVYTKVALTHFHHARWRKVFWWGGDAPEINVKHDTAYLISTGAVPNYDQTLTVPEAELEKTRAAWTGDKIEPMGIGAAASYMPATGGRPDIGILPSWAASYVLSMDKRVRDVTLGTADLAGSWSMHYRDQNTDRPVSVIDFPYMTLLGRTGDTKNPATGQYEAFPACAGADLCKSPYTHDSSHQPSLAYLPYMLTGDYYYLEELQFWSMWNILSANPGYREYEKGIIQRTQVRGQAWSLRTLAHAAYITPDDDRLKAHFSQMMSHNLDWYSNTYLNAATTNSLGVLTNGNAVVYSNKLGIGPWQDDFFTSALGHTAELGFTKATELLKWKTKFAIDRMTAPGVCWIGGSIYSLTIRDSSTAPFYTNLAQAYAATNSIYSTLACNSTEMATALGLKVSEMPGYSSVPTGYPSNMQPALAYGADVGGTLGKQAWTVFSGRSVKPDYSKAPQFAIVPR